MREIPFGRPMIGEEERNAVANVLASPQLVHGPVAKAFEVAFAKSPRCERIRHDGFFLHRWPASRLPASWAGVGR